MSQTITLRPSAIRSAGAATAVPSGTLVSVTGDNSDSTYAQDAGSGTRWALRMETNNPISTYGRHQIRARVRARVDTGAGQTQIALGYDTNDALLATTIAVTNAFAEYSMPWTSSTSFPLADTAPINKINFSASLLVASSGAPTVVQTAEVYVDVDYRQVPQYTAEIRDSAGVNRANGIVTDTTTPRWWFGSVNYDGLPALDWDAKTFDSNGNVLMGLNGTGTPPQSILSLPLADGNYTTQFTVRSTIRGSDPHTNVTTIAYAVQNIVPPPSPPVLTAEREGDGYRISWSNPGGQEWDDDYTIAEVWRDDCTGSSRIATVPNGITGTYLDLAIPQLDPQTSQVGGVCETHTEACDITYRVRYWGYVSTTVSIPSSIPVQLVLAWPGTAASIPNGWLRVTDLDGYYPRGMNGTGTPSATGGAATHVHTTPNHVHTIASHRHTYSGTTSTSSTSTNTERRTGGQVPITSATHNHTMPTYTGYSNLADSGLTAPGSDTVNNTPPTREVIWIRSDGSATAYPVGVLGFSAENVSGWTADTDSAGRYLRGAATAGNGGSTYGFLTHTHTVLSHTHTGATHDHGDGTTGVSGPALSARGVSGSGTPRWVGTHNHTVNPVQSSTGTLAAGTGGTTSSATSEPPYRALRVLRNTNGGSLTRIIGLYTGDSASIPSILTLCNGSNGTPDMRGLFCRDVTGTGGVYATGGAATHFHTTGGHSHGGSISHTHTVNINTTNTTDRGRSFAGDQGTVPTETHAHTASNTTATAAPVSSEGHGSTDVVSHLPVYKEVHFVRLDGTVAGGSLPVPEQKTSEYASITVPALYFGQEYDRIASLTTVMPVATKRGHTYSRLFTDFTPLEGGLHTVSSTTSGEELSLAIATVGKAEIDALEALLSEERVYWAPVGGTAGWFAPAGWSVAAPMPGVKVLTVKLVRTDWPATDDPEELL